MNLMSICKGMDFVLVMDIIEDTSRRVQFKKLKRLCTH